MSEVLKKLKEYQEHLAELLGKVPAKRVDMAIAGAVTVAALALYVAVVITESSAPVFSFVQNIEQRSLDARFRMRGKRPVDPRIVIIGIDEKTLQKVGAWPIPRDAYAKLVDNLKAGGAAIVSFDVTFPNPEKNSAVEALRKLQAEIQGQAPPAVIEKIREIERNSDNDAIFADSMKRAGNVILGHVFLDKERAKAMDDKAAEDYFNILWGKPFPQMIKVPEGAKFDLSQVWGRTTYPWGIQYGIEANIRLLAEAARSYGYFNYIPDGDGTFRRAPLLLRYRDRDFFPSLPLQTVREYEDIKDQSIAGYIAADGLERIELGPHVIPTLGDGRVLINYAGPYQTYPHYSVADVIDGTV